MKMLLLVFGLVFLFACGKIIDNTPSPPTPPPAPKPEPPPPTPPTPKLDFQFNGKAIEIEGKVKNAADLDAAVSAVRTAVKILERKQDWQR